MKGRTSWDDERQKLREKGRLPKMDFCALNDFKGLARPVFDTETIPSCRQGRADDLEPAIFAPESS